MSHLLIRGCLSRATRYSGTPLLRTGLRYQSSEEVAQERLAEDDDVEAGNVAANTLASNGPLLQQPRGPSAFQEKDVAPSPRQGCYRDAITQPQQNGLNLNGEHHFSRSGRVAVARPAAAGAVSAAGAQRGSPSSKHADFSPFSRVNGRVAPAAYGDENGRHVVNVNGDAGQPTLPVSRQVSPRLSNGGQNSNNSKGEARGSRGSFLNLQGDGAGGNGPAQLRKPSVSDKVHAGAAAGRSDPLRPDPAPNGAAASILKAPFLNASATASRLTNSNRVDNGKSPPPPSQAGSGFFGLSAQARSSPQAARAAAQANSKSLPWILPKAREQDDSVIQEQREVLDKMMGGGRYGGSHAAHRGIQGASRKKKKKRDVKAVAKEVQIPAVPVPVRELAMAMSKKAHEVMSMLREMGETNVSLDFMVEPDIAQMVAKELGLRTKLLKLRDSELGRTAVTEETFDSLEPRPPVVSVMGHVDHGKTTLLDALRTTKAKVAGTEAAGITQKIGAFSVEVHDSSVTFFDTPGHAAFKSMRHATSRLTDIVVVVIAADDGVKSQTVEVFELLKEFPNLTPVVAVTKIDQYDVDTEKAVDRISRQLLEHSIVTEGYGGEVPIVPVSAVTREGFDDLLETLLLQAELLELRADNKAAAEGLVVDSAIVKGLGEVADVLVTWGKLKPKDIVVAGTEYGKVRGLMNSGGKRMKEAGAAEPVRITGMKGLPKMGDEVVVVDSESTARAIIAQRKKQQEVQELEKQAAKLGAKRLSEQATKRLKHMAAAAASRRDRALYEAREAARVMKSRRDESSEAAAQAAEEFAARAMQEAEEAIRRVEAQDNEDDEGPTKCFAIFKAEGFGMLEAMSQVIEEVPQDEVELSLLKTGLGSVTQSDVEAAALADASIFAFNVGAVPPNVKAMAQKEGVQIHSHNVIYRFLDDVKSVMSSLLPPAYKENVIGEAKTLQVFEISGKNKERVMVAGLNVSSGKLSRSHYFRVVRDEEVLVYRVKAASMKIHKDRANEVTKDKECGLALEGFNEFQEGDVVQCYTLDEIEQTL